MTREEAIKVLSSYDVNGVWADVDGKPYNAEEQAEAFDMAIEALQEPKHDRDWIVGCIKHDGFIKTDRGDKANQIILEALQAEPKHGEWIEGELYIKCSECGYPAGHLSDNFCPNCEAKMDKD